MREIRRPNHPGQTRESQRENEAVVEAISENEKEDGGKKQIEVPVVFEQVESGSSIRVRFEDEAAKVEHVVECEIGDSTSRRSREALSRSSSKRKRPERGSARNRSRHRQAWRNSSAPPRPVRRQMRVPRYRSAFSSMKTENRILADQRGDRVVLQLRDCPCGLPTIETAKDGHSVILRGSYKSDVGVPGEKGGASGEDKSWGKE